MKLGSIELDSRLILSPMAGYTDLAFRILCRRAGAGLVCSEMVNSIAVSHSNEKTVKIMLTDPEDHPNSIQIFGSDTASVKNAVKEVENYCDVLGFNCGCPAFQIKKAGCGAELLDNTDLIIDIVRTIKENSSNPLMMKIRIGNKGVIDYVSLCKQIEEAGADAICVHGRTAAQGYSGKADWDAIKEIVNAVEIPVIANGDVVDRPSAKKCLDVTGAAGIAIGRAALGDPGIFRRINHYFNTGEELPIPKDDEKNAVFLEYMELAHSLGLTKQHLMSQAQTFTKGIEGAASLRRALMNAKTEKEIIEVFRQSEL